MNLPRALLFTDVVDSTKLSHALGDADMASLWAEHDRAARDLLRAHRGREIEKTDGLLALFDAAADAVAFALAYHRALAALPVPLTARAAIHVGPVGLRESSEADIAQGAKRVEVDGLVKPVTARLMATALGGQTLLSADARAALGPTPLRVQSHGHWRLKGLPEPIELFEIGEAAGTPAPFTPPPDDEKAWRVVRQRDLWLPVREVRHSVPAERDSFVGRDEPLHLLARKLDGGARLVSVLGIGGTGKTRLVTRFAWTWLGDYPGGVWFCDLSQARSVDGIHFAVAQGLDVPLGKTEPVVQLAQAIAGRGKCLVILDNFEQVARHAEETLGHWLDRAPQAQFVVTTREVLGIVGEETLALAPLPMREASELFTLRARSVGLKGDIGSADHAAIDQLVKVLDGLPLAIELAAARVNVMTPQTLLERMNKRFDVLMSRSGRRDRQATLRAAFDWSWELLSDAERSALCQLSVFEGGFTLATAEVVVDLAPGAMAVTDAVGWLVDKSFIRALPKARFDLLESIRAYATEHLQTPGRLPGSGPQAWLAATARHWKCFGGLDERDATADRCADANNIVVACRRAIESGEPAAAISCLATSWAVLRLCGPIVVCLDLAAQVDKLANLTGAHRAECLRVSGSALRVMGASVRARAHLTQGLEALLEDESVLVRSRLLLELGTLYVDSGAPEAAFDCFGTATRLARTTGDRSLEASIQNNLGRLLDHMGRLPEARTHYQTALDIARDIGDRRIEGGALGNLGGLFHAMGKHAEAQVFYEQGLELCAEVGDRRWEGNARCNLGLLDLELGRAERAAAQFEKALTIAREIGLARLEYTVLCNLGIALTNQTRHEEALGFYTRAAEAAAAAQDQRCEGQFRGYLGASLSALGRAAESLQMLAQARQLLTGVADKLSLAVVECQIAESNFRSGRFAEGDRALEEARTLADQLQVESGSELATLILKIAGSRLEPHAAGLASP